jgi:hypothetical protein
MVVTEGLAGSFLAIVDNLANRRSLDLASKSTELSSSLGMAWSLSNSTRARLQWEDVTGAAEAIRTCVGVGEGSTGKGAVTSADSGRDRGVGRVDRDGVGGASRVLVVGNHLREIEGGGEFGRERSADITRRMADEEAHLLSCHIFSGDNQIGFIFARRVVKNDEELAIAESLNRLGD